MFRVVDGIEGHLFTTRYDIETWSTRRRGRGNRGALIVLLLFCGANWWGRDVIRLDHHHARLSTVINQRQCATFLKRQDRHTVHPLRNYEIIQTFLRSGRTPKCRDGILVAVAGYARGFLWATPVVLGGENPVQITIRLEKSPFDF